MSEASPESTAHLTETRLLIRFIKLAHDFDKYTPTTDQSAEKQRPALFEPENWQRLNDENVWAINQLLGNVGGLACKLSLDAEQEEEIFTLKELYGFGNGGQMIWQLAELPDKSAFYVHGPSLIKDLRSMHIQGPDS